MNTILSILRSWIWLRSPLRIAYHLIRGVVAFALSGNPAKHMYIIGVTGTKGKTTTCTLIAKALKDDGKKVCLITTAQLWMGDDIYENRSKMTMDSPFALWKTLRKARSLWITHLVLETSSHGIYYYRNYGIQYDIALLTNISQDHLDLHGTMDHYVATKARLFKKKHTTTSLLPLDCPYFEVFKKASKECMTYSMISSADFMATHVSSGENISLNISHARWTTTIQSGLTGFFNAENMLWAYSILHTLGISDDSIQKSWHDFSGAPGRMERVSNTLGITIIIDYAHTEESLRSVLSTLRVSMKSGKLIIVFGATGDRDTTKREKMGKVAHQLADVIILTDDDTYTESSEKIIDMIKQWIPRPLGETYSIIPDRKLAIIQALKTATTWDIVLLAGKWSETVMVTNNWPIPWSDRTCVEEFFNN